MAGASAQGLSKWDEDPAWPDRDPMTAAEREAWLDRLCQLDDEVLAADQRISWWAGELKKAGLAGGMDELRARAFLDLVLGKDSRPRDPQATDTTGHDGAPGAGPAPGTGPAGGAAGGFAGRVTLTVPLGTAPGWPTGRAHLHHRTHPVPGLAAGDGQRGVTALRFPASRLWEEP